MKTVYLIGQPGSGKTTLAKAFLEQFEREHREKDPFKHEIYRGPLMPVVSLGWQGDELTFGGTDMLPNTVITKVLAWQQEQEEPVLVFGEGDRLANQRFFYACAACGEIVIVFVNTPDHIAAERRQTRALEANKKLQNASWIKGRVTKSKNLASSNQVVTIDGTADLTEQLEALNQAVG